MNKMIDEIVTHRLRIEFDRGKPKASQEEGQERSRKRETWGKLKMWWRTGRGIDDDPDMRWRWRPCGNYQSRLPISPSSSSRINVLSWIIATSYEFLSIIDHRWNPFRRRNKEIDFLHWMASYFSFYYIFIYLIENRIENIEWIKRL